MERFRRALSPLLFAVASLSVAAACSPPATVSREPAAPMGASPAATATMTSGDGPVAKFDASGMLVRPEGYREWIYIGTPLTPNDMNKGNAPFPEFHNVYVDPQSYAEWKRTGQFRDGTVIIKELTSVGSKAAASGNGYFMGEFTGLEAAVKDTKRFSAASNGWAYFSYGHTYPLAAKAAAQPNSVCASCHLTAPNDMVFAQYYPVLRASAKTTK